MLPDAAEVPPVCALSVVRPLLTLRSLQVKNYSLFEFSYLLESEISGGGGLLSLWSTMLTTSSGFCRSLQAHGTLLINSY